MMAFPSRIKHVSCILYSPGNLDSSFSQIGQELASCCSLSDGFLIFGFIINHVHSLPFNEDLIRLKRSF